MLGGHETLEKGEGLSGAEFLEGVFGGLVEKYGVVGLPFPREVLSAAMTRGDKYKGLQIAYMKYRMAAVLEIGGKRFLVSRGERNLAYPDSLTSGDLLTVEFAGDVGNIEKLTREAALLISDQGEYSSSVILERNGRLEWGKYGGENLQDPQAGEPGGEIEFEDVSGLVDLLVSRIENIKKETPVGRRLE